MVKVIKVNTRPQGLARGVHPLSNRLQLLGPPPNCNLPVRMLCAKNLKFCDALGLGAGYSEVSEVCVEAKQKPFGQVEQPRRMNPT